MSNKPSAARALKFWLSDTYNNLGKVVLVNLFWTACSVPSILIGIHTRKNFSPLAFLALVVSFLLTSPALGGMFYLSRKIVVNDPYLEMRDFFDGVKKYWEKSLILLAISLITPALILGALVFYGQLARFHPAGVILWVLSLWGIIFFLLMQTYFFPLMVTQDMGIKQILKTSLFLALGNAGFTVIVVLVQIIFLALFAITGIIFIGGISTICLLQTNAFLEISKRYTGEEIRKERKKEYKSPKQFFREIFMPWKYD